MHRHESSRHGSRSLTISALYFEVNIFTRLTSACLCTCLPIQTPASQPVQSSSKTNANNHDMMNKKLHPPPAPIPIELTLIFFPNYASFHVSSPVSLFFTVVAQSLSAPGSAAYPCPCPFPACPLPAWHSGPSSAGAPRYSAWPVAVSVSAYATVTGSDLNLSAVGAQETASLARPCRPSSQERDPGAWCKV